MPLNPLVNVNGVLVEPASKWKMEKGLKLRLISSLIMAPIAIGLIVMLPTPYFALVLGAFFVAGAWEWAALVSVPKLVVRYTYTASVVGLMIAAWFSLTAIPAFITIVISVAVGWWILILLLVLTYPQSSRMWNNAFAKAMAGYLILVPAWLAMISLHGSGPDGPYYALYFFMMIWLADIAAYFSGRFWGKNKLAPHVSPGKSWEGVFGALGAVSIYTVIASYFMGIFKLGTNILLIYIAISLFAVLVSVLGDLAESMFKRQAHLKDSGTLFPGHGGVLDRFDSLTAAAPTFLLCYWGFSGLGGGQMLSYLEMVW
ncbi:MAG: phosphatidate cytidylyltransferase [Gammaproteobacteria bacterium]|nr:phosphatidate cytidylyltransferase [Gammaproteobacteria bacterium]